ncbi:MAG: ferritin-like domain-containing protein [Myxococcales bacterium]|nr:ferritin-like domain-containing protein [Myxococcales bacterium]MCB9705901.1 ferritin-like domain-containing protein [Myxococcales bacterium]
MDPRTLLLERIVHTLEAPVVDALALDALACRSAAWASDASAPVGTPSLGCGRPFSVGSLARVAEAATGREWSVSVSPSLDALDAATRERLADAWTDDGLAEHASVASFARFILELLAVGAPAELIVRAQRALADEIDHARLCFALASAYRGAAVGPGKLAIDAALDGSGELTAVVARALVEGCIGETLAAFHAGIAASEAADPAVAGVLRRIADDELEHAALAWSFVRWALDVGGLGGGEALLDEAIEAAEEAASVPIDEVATRELLRHGRLDPIGEALLRRDGVRTVVLPALRGLARSVRARRAASPARDRGQAIA